MLFNLSTTTTDATDNNTLKEVSYSSSTTQNHPPPTNQIPSQIPNIISYSSPPDHHHHHHHQNINLNNNNNYSSSSTTTNINQHDPLGIGGNNNNSNKSLLLSTTTTSGRKTKSTTTTGGNNGGNDHDHHGGGNNKDPSLIGQQTLYEYMDSVAVRHLVSDNIDSSNSYHHNNNTNPDFKYKKLTQRDVIRILCVATSFTLVTFIIVSVVCVSTVYYLENYRISSNFRMGQEKIQLAHGNIGKQLTKTFNSLLVMKDQVKHWNFTITDGKFNGLSSRLSWVHPEVYLFEYAVGPNASVDFIHPPVEEIYGLHMGKNDPNHMSAMQEAIARNETRLFGPILLIEGGVAVIAQHPIFYHNGSVFGFAVELFKFDQLFSAINFTELLQGYQYQIYDYYKNAVFLESLDGTAEYKSALNQNVSIINDTISKNISVYNCRWKILLRPVNGWNWNSILWSEILIALFVMVSVSVTTFVAIFATCFKIGAGTNKKMRETFLESFNNVCSETITAQHDWGEICASFRERARRMQKIINNLPIPVVTASISDGRIVSVNFALTKLYGYDLESISNINLKDLIPDLEIEEVFNVNIINNSNEKQPSSSSSITIQPHTLVSANNTRHPVALSISFSVLAKGVFGLISITPITKNGTLSSLISQTTTTLIPNNTLLLDNPTIHLLPSLSEISANKDSTILSVE